TATLVSLTHWLRFVAPVAEADKPPCTKPTVGVGFEINSEVAPLIEIDAMTGVAPAADPPLNAVALTRALVMRMTRVWPAVTGARIGIPKNVIELPLTRPWNTLAPELLVVAVQTLPVNVAQPSAGCPMSTLFVVVFVRPTFCPVPNPAGLVVGG